MSDCCQTLAHLEQLAVHFKFMSGSFVTVAEERQIIGATMGDTNAGIFAPFWQLGIHGKY